MGFNLQQKFHALTSEEVEGQLKTSAHGLCDSEVYLRRKLFGKNCIKEKEKSLFAIFFRQLNSPLIFILFAAAFISLFLSEITDFIVVMVIISFNTIIGFWQEVKAEFSLEALKKMTETKNIVLREGKMKLIPSSDLVPGDWFIFHQGEVVTADVRIIESSSLMVDESTITGESVPVLKQHGKILPEDTFPFEWTNMLLSGSTIVRGKGSGIVVRTGNSTYLASIGEKAQEAAPSTPLQIALKSFSKRYVLLILGILGLVAIVGFFQGRSFLDLLYILLSSLVSAVPEGLPIIVTLVMVFGAHFLRKRDTLVRDLPSVETLGSATVIATDKTGTITEGRLLVKEAYDIDSEILKRIGSLCNDEKDGLGDPIDVALSDWIGNVQDIRLQYPQKWNYPFDSDLMLMATAHTVKGVDTLYVKGAYEVLREKAKDQLGLENFDAKFNAFLEKGYRVLAFGESVFISQDPSKWELKLVGIIGFLDPPKRGVRHAVAAAKKAGIHVIMVTGDHPLTAQTIAHEVGIWKKQDRVLIGKEIEKMTDKELLAALGSTTVLARILPEHKYRVVKALQLKGEIVAVTGDGVNDIPALKASNIGIAMGNGTEAAKSVSQMVLVDNNFTIIVDAIKNARVIAANIRKAIYYLISTSLQELSVLCLSVFTSMPIPLTAIQILWINLVTDGVMDKTFPFTKEEGDVMKQSPRASKDAFFDRDQMKNMLFFGLTQGVFCFGLYKFLFSRFPFETVSTILFTSIVCAQWANAIQAQKEQEPFFYNIKKSFTINPFVFLALLIGILLQCGVLYLIPSLFKSVSLTSEQWLFPLMSFAVSFLSVEIRKWFQWYFAFRAKAKTSSH